jgi:hypothetical protein
LLHGSVYAATAASRSRFCATAPVDVELQVLLDQRALRAIVSFNYAFHAHG